MNKELAEKIINNKESSHLIDVNPCKLNYSIGGKPLLYLQANTLEKREQWYKDNYPQHPDKLSYYLARASLGDPVTDEEIQRKKQSDKNNMEAEKRRLAKLAKTKEKREQKKNNKKKGKNNTNQLKVQHGEFILKF